MTSGDYPNYSIIKFNQNTEKSPGDMKRLAVTQTPVEIHQLMLMWKTLKGVIMKIIEDDPLGRLKFDHTNIWYMHKRIRYIKFSGIFRYKWTTSSQPED